MDSLTQFALGSAVCLATLGRRTAAWKAVLWGGVAGTLPDLDAFIDHGDAVLNMVRHRAETHSLILLTLFSPLLAAAVARLQGEWAHWRRWWLALWLVLITHPLLDAFTVYGTQLLQPLSDHPYGLGSMFIIDPAYTLPLLLGLGVALATRGRVQWVNGLALTWGMAYLLASVVAQQQVASVARASLTAQGVSPQALLVTPTPFNIVLWRVVALTPTHHLEGYRSLLDRHEGVRWSAHPRGAEALEWHRDHPAVSRLHAFSHGFVRLREVEGRLELTDLRMGQEPTYVFRFDLGDPLAHPPPPAVQRSERPDLDRALPWLWRRLLGEDLPGLSEVLSPTR